MNIIQVTYNTSIQFNFVEYNQIKRNETEGLTELLENTSWKFLIKEKQGKKTGEVGFFKSFYLYFLFWTGTVDSTTQDKLSLL